MKKLTLKKLRTIALSKKCAKSNCYNELYLIIVPDKEDTKSYEKLNLYIQEKQQFIKKRNLKNPRTMKDYNKGKIVYGWLNDKKNNDNLFYTNDLLKYEMTIIGLIRPYKYVKIIKLRIIV